MSKVILIPYSHIVGQAELKLALESPTSPG